MNEVLRQEKKFLISLAQMYEYSGMLEKIMMADVHNQGDGYVIRSLYFDTLDDKDYTEKEDGVELRRKIRLRCYGSDFSYGVLEMKQKQGAMQKKRSLKMSKEDAVKLIHRDYGVLLNYEDPFAQECYALMSLQGYVPKSVVEYRRKAYIAKENKIRVTFDHHIVGTESCFDIFRKDLLQNSLLEPYLAVLEVKFNGFLLTYIKDLLLRCQKSELSVSKYSLSRAVSKHYTFM
nr:polyphosphate polymerase domain-containing protein [uncultured Blautia sp.]